MAGMWYSDEGVRDFKWISTSNNLCLLYPDALADQQDQSWCSLSPREAQAATDREATMRRDVVRLSGVEEGEGGVGGVDGRKGGAGRGRKGSGVGKERYGGRVDWREEEEEGDWRDGSRVRYSADEGEEGEERGTYMDKRRRLVSASEHKPTFPTTLSPPNTKPSLHPPNHHQPHPRSSNNRLHHPYPWRCGGLRMRRRGSRTSLTRSCTTSPTSSAVTPRVYGRFESPCAVTRYLNLSAVARRACLAKWPRRGRMEKVGYVPRHGTYMGGFGEAVVPLMQAAGECKVVVRAGWW
ncbi:unnamed protein product [Closterium sp. Yama58-4]|nr:unnamed protein product [Closterium sp. Yama58-4]